MNWALKVPLESDVHPALRRRADDRTQGIVPGEMVAALWWNDPHYYVGMAEIGPDGVSLGLWISDRAFRYLGDALHVVRVAERPPRPRVAREHVPARVDRLDALIAIWIAEARLDSVGPGQA